jgi:hypothetical protein
MSPRSDELGPFFVHLFEGLAYLLPSPVFPLLPQNARDLSLTVPLLKLGKYYMHPQPSTGGLFCILFVWADDFSDRYAACRWHYSRQRRDNKGGIFCAAENCPLIMTHHYRTDPVRVKSSESPKPNPKKIPKSLKTRKKLSKWFLRPYRLCTRLKRRE